MSAQESALMEGIELRDFFAGLVMGGLLAAQTESSIHNPKLLCEKAASLAECAFAQADALLL